jgi:hypothetical protein
MASGCGGAAEPIVGDQGVQEDRRRVVEEGVQQANLQLASVENVHSALEDGRQQVSMEVDVLNGGQTGNDHVGQGEVLVNKGTEAFEAGALAPSGDQVGSQDGKIHAEGGLDVGCWFA